MMMTCLLLAGCWTEAGEAVADALGANTPDGELSPATTLFGSVGPILPGGMGIVLLWIAKIAHTALRAKKALFESTTEAIDNKSLVLATSHEEVKNALNIAQKAHDDSKLLAAEYDKHKNGGVVKKIINKFIN